MNARLNSVGLWIDTNVFIIEHDKVDEYLNKLQFELNKVDELISAASYYHTIMIEIECNDIRDAQAKLDVCISIINEFNRLHNYHECQ